MTHLTSLQRVNMYTFRSTVFLLPALTMALLAACNRNPSDNTAMPSDAPSSTSSMAASSGTIATAMTEVDRTFMQKAAGGGLYEVEVSKLAAMKASNPQIKAFAGMLVDHHTDANGQLMNLSKPRGVALADAVPPEKRAVIDQMASLSGAAFDQQFVKQVGIADHEADIRLFEAASTASTDPDLKAWAAKMLPTLREHLAAAQQLPVSTQASAAPEQR